MELIKNSIDNTPPLDAPLLMLVDLGGDEERYIWTVGVWDDTFGWSCRFDDEGYTVVEWYELPDRHKPASPQHSYSYQQMRMEDFWNDK